MAGSKTQFMVKKALDTFLGGAVYTRPTTIYWALSQDPFNFAATMDSINEITESEYQRVGMPNDASNWDEATDAYPSVKFNANDITFATSTNGWDQQPASVYLADAATNGNVLYGADLSSPASITAGNAFKIEAGTFILQEF